MSNINENKQEKNSMNVSVREHVDSIKARKNAEMAGIVRINESAYNQRLDKKVSVSQDASIPTPPKPKPF